MSKKSVSEIKITQRKDGRYMARYSHEKLLKPLTIYGKTEEEVREQLIIVSKAVSNTVFGQKNTADFWRNQRCFNGCGDRI